ncbi:MAG: type II secretion system protein GspG [Blastopirellula sp.]|nr:MAG: type II secretion system protein GspG [Blastopirellula sp.]
MQRKTRRRRRSGFTLIEVLLVLVILVILGSFAGLAIFAAQKQALVKQAKVQVLSFEGAIDFYKLNMNIPPQSLQDLIEQPADAKSGKWQGPYLTVKEIPKDPWENDYEYEVNGAEYNIWSIGPDGSSGTDDDISS